MAEMTVAMHRARVGADHTMYVVFEFVDIFRHDRLGEARPAGAGIELVGRSEQRFAGNDVDIDPWRLVVIVLPP